MNCCANLLSNIVSINFDIYKTYHFLDKYIILMYVSASTINIIGGLSISDLLEAGL